MATVNDFYDALRHLEHSGMSWSGFNVFGDDKSIKEVKRLTNLVDRCLYLEAMLKELTSNKSCVSVTTQPVEECVHMDSVCPESILGLEADNVTVVEASQDDIDDWLSGDGEDFNNNLTEALDKQNGTVREGTFDKGYVVIRIK